MAQGNRVHEPIRVVHKEWEGKSTSHSKIADWIKNCSDNEKEIAIKNKIASDEFHKRS